MAPTISSLTSQAPGRYLWRILIALHSAPRILALLCYWTYYERVLTTYIEPRFRLRAAAAKAKASAPLASASASASTSTQHTTRNPLNGHRCSSVASPVAHSPSLVMNAAICSRVGWPFKVGTLLSQCSVFCSITLVILVVVFVFGWPSPCVCFD